MFGELKHYVQRPYVWLIANVLLYIAAAYLSLSARACAPSASSMTPNRVINVFLEMRFYFIGVAAQSGMYRQTGLVSSLRLPASGSASGCLSMPCTCIVHSGYRPGRSTITANAFCCDLKL